MRACTTGANYRQQDTKRPKKSNCHFWRAGSKSRVLRMPPALNTTKGGGQTISAAPLAWLLDPPLPSPRIRNQLPPPWGASEQGNLLLVLAPLCCSKGPRKAVPEFLVWPLVNFYWLEKAKNPGQYQIPQIPSWESEWRHTGWRSL